VRILVTVETAFDLEMRLSHMALGTFGDWLLYRRRMSYVAASTSDARVLSAGGGYVSRRTGMTLHTVFVRHRGLFLNRCRACHARTGQKHGETYDQE
jgi:hypothetical protein